MTLAPVISGKLPAFPSSESYIMVILTRSQYRKLGLITNTLEANNASSIIKFDTLSNSIPLASTISPSSALTKSNSKGKRFTVKQSTTKKLQSNIKSNEIDIGNEQMKKIRSSQLIKRQECPICYEILKKKNEFTCPTCKQKAHKTCFEKSFKNNDWQKMKNCPYCRSVIDNFLPFT